MDAQPGAPQHHDQGIQAMPVTITAGLAQDGDDLIDRRRVGGVMLALVPRGDPLCGTRAWSPASGVGR